MQHDFGISFVLVVINVIGLLPNSAFYQISIKSGKSLYQQIFSKLSRLQVICLKLGWIMYAAVRKQESVIILSRKRNFIAEATVIEESLYQEA